MKRTVLMIHADKAPEFLEVEGAARYAMPGETGWPGEVTYESLGRVVVGLETDPEGIGPEAYAEIRSFAHPDIIAAVKERGERREAHSPWGVVS